MSLSGKQIEELLSQLQDGDVSEDNEESDEDDCDFYPSRAEVEAALQDDGDEDDNRHSDNEEYPDLSLVNDEAPDPQPSCSAQNKNKANKARVLWKKQSLLMEDSKTRFVGNADFPEEIMSLDTPLQFFNYFFTPELITKIVEQTATYSVQKQPDRPPSITECELRQYLGILILMSVYHYPSIRSYWGNKHGFQAIKNTMPVNRFEKIRSVLHFNDNDNHLPVGHPHHDVLHKLRPVVDHLNERFSSVPLHQRLSIDEQMCATKMGHFLKQYLPNKPHKWGFKLFVLCSLLGYAYKFLIYTGKDKEPMLANEPDIGAVGNTVIKLSRHIPRKVNHIVYFDNFYTSLPLLHYLATEGIWCLGTMQRKRLGKACKLPTKQDVMKKSVLRGTFEEYMTNYDGVDITGVSWKDNKQVVLLSTYVGAERYERYEKAEKRRSPSPVQK